MTFPAWPPMAPFPEAQRDSFGDGTPDFPGDSGGREKGKFRPSAVVKLTTIAVVNDDGTVIGTAQIATNEEQLLELRAIRIGIEHLLRVMDDRWDSDLLELASD